MKANRMLIKNEIKENYSFPACGMHEEEDNAKRSRMGIQS